MNWKGNRLWIFAVVLVALGTGVFFAWRAREHEGDADSHAEAPTLPHVVRDQVDSIELGRPHEEPVHLVASPAGWRIHTPIEAKADQNAVNAILDKIAALESTGIAGSNRANHARLEVDPEHAVHVVVKHGATVLINFWIGGYRSGATMVRLDGQDRVHMVDGALRYLFAKELKDWRDRAVVEVTPERITELTFQDEHGTFHFVHGAAWAPAPDQAPIERFEETKLQSLALSLAHLRATDFADAAATADVTGLGGPEQATVTMQLAASDAGAAEQIVLHIGKPHGEGSADRYAQRVGDDSVYVLSGYVAERLRPDVAGFQQSPDAGAPPPPPPGGPEGMEMPGGMQMGGPGGGQIPPELMRQIQQQLQQQGAAGH